MKILPLTYLCTRKNWVNFGSHPPPDPNPGFFKKDSSTLRDRTFSPQFGLYLWGRVIGFSWKVYHRCCIPGGRPPTCVCHCIPTTILSDVSRCKQFRFESRKAVSRSSVYRKWVPHSRSGGAAVRASSNFLSVNIFYSDSVTIFKCSVLVSFLCCFIVRRWTKGIVGDRPSRPHSCSFCIYRRVQALFDAIYSYHYYNTVFTGHCSVMLYRLNFVTREVWNQCNMQ